MGDKYILRGRVPIPVNDLMEWAKWFETANRHVASDTIGGIRVSTVFLGIDHSFGGARPLIFETMIFGGKNSEYQTRASTWDEAEKQHKEALRIVRQELN